MELFLPKAWPWGNNDLYKKKKEEADGEGSRVEAGEVKKTKQENIKALKITNMEKNIINGILFNKTVAVSKHLI